MSALFYKYWHKIIKGFHKFSLTYWLFQFVTLSIGASIMDSYSGIVRIISEVVIVVLVALVFPAIYLRIEKVRKATSKEGD